MAFAPFASNGNLFSQLERMFDRAFERAIDRTIDFDALPDGEQLKPQQNQLMPWKGTYGSLPIDVHENDAAFEITADTPGFAPENLKVELQDNMISITGERKDERQEKDKDGKLVRQERRMNRFFRSFALPDNVNVEAVKASLDKGVLKLTIPKLEPATKPEPKRIEITTTAELGQ